LNLFLRKLWRKQGLCLFRKQERVIFTLRITQAMTLEKVGEFTPEETSQTPPAPMPEHPAETPSSAEPRKKRIKTLAGRTDLP